MRCLRPALWWVAVTLAWADPAAGAPRRQAAESLVPANMQPLQDDKGDQWSINNYGFLQNTGSSFFNNILMLHVGGQQFYNYQPLMTPDGKEFVLPGQQPMMGLQVTRRVRLLEKEGIMRYVDLFHNPGSSPITASIEYRNNFSNPLKTVVTDRGTATPGSLSRNETGLLISSRQQGQKSVVFTLCGPQSGVKPAFLKRSQYEWNFNYSVTVPPGQTAGLCYAVGLVTPFNEADRSALERAFKPLAPGRLLKTVRREDLPVLANFSQGMTAGPAGFLAAAGVDALEVERGRSDVLAIGAKTRLVGTASCGRLEIETPYGSTEIPFERVAAVVGEARQSAHGSRVFLRDGQVLSGRVTAEEFRFALPSGASIDLDMPSLDRLVRSATPEENRWDPGTAALLVTFAGDQIAVAESPGAELGCTTPWGPLSFTLADILWLGPGEEGAVGHQIEFRDGSRFFGFLAGGPVRLETRLFGSREFSPAQLRAVVTSDAVTRSRENAEAAPLDQPHLVLAGGQRLLGQVEAPSLSILTPAKAIALPPQSIRTLRNISDEAEEGERHETPPFQVDLWGGSTLVGQLKEAVVPVRVRQSLWRVPIDDLLEINNPSPRVTDETRLRLAALIRDLGSTEWEKREQASQTLAEYGFMARPALEEALKTTPDPEVRRRVEQLLEELE